MHVLRIEHTVADYDTWKQSFDSDPVGRANHGVRSYRILRSVDDPTFVMIDLEFDSADEAGTMHTALQELWGRVDVVKDPRARAAEVMEAGKV